MKEIGMTTRRMAIVAGVAALLAIAIALATCSGTPDSDGGSAQAAAAGSGAADAAEARGTADAKEAFELIPALLQAYAQGLRKEVDIIQRPARGTHSGLPTSKSGAEEPEAGPASAPTC